MVVWRKCNGLWLRPCTVLINGKTVTGKELIACVIQQRSNHNEKLIVAMNCAALPAILVESELFGYERRTFAQQQFCNLKQKGLGIFA